MTQKTEIRQNFLQIRKNLPKSRRELASLELLCRLKKYSSLKVLSFFPCFSEIDLAPFNDHLFQQKTLFLPFVEGEEIIPYKVENFSSFTRSEFGVYEPCPEKHLKASIEEIDVVLVPGIAFDRQGRRLGYGKGFYDRLLAKNPEILSIGIGYQEQFSKDLLPQDPWDISLKELLLV